jgi:double-stranded uracil-DNA glycosylase
MRQVVKQGMGPIATPDARLFILGSLPGDASLAAQRYYAHPTNQFWRLLGAAIGEPLAAMGYAERLDRLAERGIGLWDVVASAERAGSLDGAIRQAGHNPIERLKDDYPNLKAVAFNGQTAAKLGRKLLGAASGIALIDLPSSSAAYTRRFADKAAVWRQLGRFCSNGVSGA